MVQRSKQMNSGKLVGWRLPRQLFGLCLIASLGLVGSGLTGCSEQVSGPEPGLEDPVVGQDLPVSPGIICQEQHPEDGTRVEISGEEFAPVPVDLPNDPTVALPSVELVKQTTLEGEAETGASIPYASEPGETNAALLSWESQSLMAFHVVDSLTLGDGAAGMIPAGIYDVQVTNPNDKQATSMGALAVAPRPTLTEVSPGIVCVADEAKTITLTGQTVLRIGENEAVVRIAGTEFSVDSLEGCTTVAHEGLDAEFCETVTVTLDQGSLQPGFEDVTIGNPQTAACDSRPDEDNVKLRVASPPEITGVEPSLVCTAQGAQEVTLTGSNFLEIDGVMPTVTVDGESVTVQSIDGCSVLETQGADVQTCTEVTVELAQDDTITDVTRPEIELTNPAPADCSASSTDELVVVPPPSITAIEPSNLCVGSQGPFDITVTGNAFLRTDTETFTVAVDGASVTPTNISGCTDLQVPGETTEVCTSFDINIDPDTSTAGGIEISITNPGDASCDLSTSEVFAITEPPSITGIQPANICSDQQETVTITGSGFASGATVTIGGVDATTVTVATDGTSIEAEYPTGLPAGTHDVTVNNGPGCGSTLPNALEVDPTPLVFFVDPPVLYSEISVEVTIFSTGLDADASNVELVADDGTATALTNVRSPARPNRILGTVPSGLDSGAYDVRVTSDIGCAGTLDDAVTITDTLTIDLASVDPAFVSPTASTGVTINAESTSAAKFVATPRVYLNPNPTQSGAVATSLRATEFQDDETLNAVVPDGLTPGTYDLIVVNPAGEVGLLTQGVTVTVEEPPAITGVQPGSFDAGATTAATVFGENFQTAATVSFTCDLNGATTTPPITTNTVTPTAIDITADMSAVSAGNICLVEVTNPDGASFEFSAVSVKSPAQNLFPSSIASNMQQARRALGLEAGRPTATSRFLYAIGGDDGTEAGAKTSVESARVGVFGALGSWFTQRYSLPEARTLSASTIIGRYIYMVGGSNGTAAQNSVYRAQILDPLAGPEVNDLDAELGDGTVGLEGGTWYYKISAIFPNNDPNNPEGESLPGELLSVQLPDNPDKIVLTLTWDQVAGASGYRVYRTAAPNGDSNNVELLAEVAGGTNTTLIDDGQSGVTANRVPLPPGSLGQWRDLGTSALNTARANHATVAVQNPNAADQYFMYAFGGRDDTGTVLDSYEWATIDVAADGSQTVSAWTTGTRTIGSAKEGLVAWMVTDRESGDVVAGETYLFVGTGFGSNGQATGDINSGFLDSTSADGDLMATAGATLDAENGIASGRGGAVGAAGNDFLFILGGQRGGLTGNDQSTQIVNGPNLDNWNALGAGTLQVRRTYPAIAQESAFFFIAGGGDGAGNAVDAVEQTVK
jgi:hypothetical protein